MYRVVTIQRSKSPVGGDAHDIHFLSVPAKDKTAPVLILSHGFPGDAFDWSGQLAHFAGRFQLVAPFLPGAADGRAPPRGRLTVASLVADLGAVVQAVDPEGRRRIYLLGHDVGCFFNVAYAEQQPGRISGLLNVNGMGLRQYSRRLYRLDTWRRSFYVVLAQSWLVRRLVTNVIPRAVLKVIYAWSQVETPDATYRRGRRGLASIGVYVSLFRAALAGFGRPARKLAVPTLFVWGNRDAFLALPRPSEVARFYDQAAIRVVRGGHWVSRSQPDHTNRILTKTLAAWEAQHGAAPRQDEVLR